MDFVVWRRIRHLCRGAEEAPSEAQAQAEHGLDATFLSSRSMTVLHTELDINMSGQRALGFMRTDVRVPANVEPLNGELRPGI